MLHSHLWCILYNANDIWLSWAILNNGPSASIDHTSLISPQFLRASIESGQTSQIDLSGSQIDLNSNIQLTYPETSATSFTENTSENYFTGNNVSGNGNDSTGNDVTGTGNYREIGQEMVAQQLAAANVDSFALIYNDGNAHFQGSVPKTTYDLSSIEPIDGANTTIES